MMAVTTRGPSSFFEMVPWSKLYACGDAAMTGPAHRSPTSRAAVGSSCTLCSSSSRNSSRSSSSSSNRSCCWDNTTIGTRFLKTSNAEIEPTSSPRLVGSRSNLQGYTHPHTHTPTHPLTHTRHGWHSHRMGFTRGECRQQLMVAPDGVTG